MVNETMETRDPYNHPYMHKRVSWSAIVMGALVGLGLGFLLNLFGFAIGLSAFTQPEDGAATIAIGGCLGMLIGVIVTMTAAGYTAGYFGRYHCPHRNLGIVYGFCTWTLSLILAALIAGPVTQHAMNLSNTATQVTQQAGGAETIKPTGDQGAQGNQGTQNQVAQAMTQPGTWAWGMFLIFVMFFIGALFSCLGAIWGMSCKRND